MLGYALQKYHEEKYGFKEDPQKSNYILFSAKKFRSESNKQKETVKGKYK